MSTPTDDALRALLDQLTPGPWIQTRPQDDQLYDIHHKYDILAEAIERRQDAEFIAAAPSLVADLLARADFAEQERDAALVEVGELRTALEGYIYRYRIARAALDSTAEDAR